METIDHFKNIIKAYLDKRAAEDALFAEAYKKEKKSIDECCAYIMGEAQKQSVDISSGVKCAPMDRDEVFSLAVHYYDEDNIKVEKVPTGRVAVNHTIELTEEEKQQAKENAIKSYQDNLLVEMTKKSAKPKAKKVKEDIQQLSLF